MADLIAVYVENKRSPEELGNVNWVLSEAITRLWTQKHKELGRFSSVIFKLIEAIIDNVLQLLLRTASTSRSHCWW